jgi:hypothetical protein
MAATGLGSCPDFLSRLLFRHRLGGRRKALSKRVVLFPDRVQVALHRLELVVLQSRPRWLGRRLEYRNIIRIAGWPRLADEIGRRPDVGGESKHLEPLFQDAVLLLRIDFRPKREKGGKGEEPGQSDPPDAASGAFGTNRAKHFSVRKVLLASRTGTDLL